MIKDAIASCVPDRAGQDLIGLTRDRDFKAIIDRVMKLPLASDVALRCLDRSVPNQKLKLFEFAAAIMAESGAGATKTVRRQISYAGTQGTPLDRIPDHVRCDASFLSLSSLRNSSEYSSFVHARMPEPCVQKLLGP